MSFYGTPIYVVCLKELLVYTDLSLPTRPRFDNHQRQEICYSPENVERL
jgi:hypothetical protein